MLRRLYLTLVFCIVVAATVTLSYMSLRRLFSLYPAKTVLSSSKESKVNGAVNVDMVEGPSLFWNDVARNKIQIESFAEILVKRPVLHRLSWEWGCMEVAQRPKSRTHYSLPAPGIRSDQLNLFLSYDLFHIRATSILNHVKNTD
jgi:hypothetical protein